MDNKSSPIIKICSFIVDKRNLFFLIYLLLIIFSLFSSNWVSVENDLSAYLSEDTETRQGLDLMESEYTTFGSAKVMISNISLDEAFRVYENIQDSPGDGAPSLIPGAEDVRRGKRERLSEALDALRDRGIVV